MSIELITYLFINLLFVCSLAGIVSLFSYFIDYCLWDGSIFQSYLPALARMVVSQSDYDEVKMLAEHLQNDEMMNRAQSVFHYKILGGCIICTNAWLAIITFIPLNLITGTSFFFMPVFVVFSSFILRKIIA